MNHILSCVISLIVNLLVACGVGYALLMGKTISREMVLFLGMIYVSTIMAVFIYAFLYVVNNDYQNIMRKKEKQIYPIYKG